MPEHEDSDLLAVDLSAKLITLFSKKSRAHNKSNPDSKVSAKELKSVFINASSNENCFIGYTKLQWSVARVNTFLRVLSGDIPELIKERQHTSLGGLIFESKIIKEQKEHDISENWAPSSEDLALAKKEIEENELNYNFKDINELYLKEEEPVGLVFNFEL
tara:strand:+ start:15673 stop:16155 length:483 start_codon:yes stop_codon:yes gene_type:complete